MFPYNSVVRDTPSKINGWWSMQTFGVPLSQASISLWGMPQSRQFSDDMLRAHRAASKNYRRVHGQDVPYFVDIWHLIREYSHIPTLEELSAKTADLSRRIDAAKAKHGVM